MAQIALDLRVEGIIADGNSYIAEATSLVANGRQVVLVFPNMHYYNNTKKPIPAEVPDEVKVLVEFYFSSRKFEHRYGGLGVRQET